MTERSASFRKFVMDPKATVMTYIADNIPQDQLSQQQGHFSNGKIPMNSINSENGGLQAPTQAPPSRHGNQSHNNSMRPQPPPQQQNGMNSTSQSPPQQTDAQPAQSLQVSSGKPYLASNLINSDMSNSTVQLPNGSQGQMSANPPFSNPMAHQASPNLGQSYPSHQNIPLQTYDQFENIQSDAQGRESFGQKASLANTRPIDSAESARSSYHRLFLDFERTKLLFFNAKSQRNPQVMKLAYELEGLSRKLWKLRLEHSQDFEGYQEAGHQAIISQWRSQYELWADTVLDTMEEQLGSRDDGSYSHGQLPMNGPSEALDMQGRSQEPGRFPFDGEDMQSRPSNSPQQAPQFQNFSLGPNKPGEQNSQFPQSMQPVLPGAVPINAQSPPVQNGGPPAMPFQQPQHPPPPNMGGGQNAAPGAFPGSQGALSMPSNYWPSVQQEQYPPPRSGPLQQGHNIPPGPGPNPQGGQNRKFPAIPTMQQQRPPMNPNEHYISQRPLTPGLAPVGQFMPPQ